ADAAIAEPEDKDAAKLERLYAGKKLVDPAYRIEVRKKLLRGWRAEDAEHYILATNSADKPLIKRVLSDLPVGHQQQVHELAESRLVGDEVPHADRGAEVRQRREMGPDGVVERR
ncbi:MAG: hypothetical protein ACK58T_28555, partial [Phycisphaerae bacterium]